MLWGASLLEDPCTYHATSDNFVRKLWATSKPDTQIHGLGMQRTLLLCLAIQRNICIGSTINGLSARRRSALSEKYLGSNIQPTPTSYVPMYLHYSTALKSVSVSFDSEGRHLWYKKQRGQLANVEELHFLRLFDPVQQHQRPTFRDNHLELVWDFFSSTSTARVTGHQHF